MTTNNGQDPNAGRHLLGWAHAAGFANVAGFVTSFYLHGALSILGISVILLQSAQAFFVVKMLGAAYLCWIGLKALWDAWKGAQVTQNVAPAKRQLYRSSVDERLNRRPTPCASPFDHR